MAILIAPGTLAQIRQTPEQFVLQVQGASDEDRAREGLARGAAELAARGARFAGGAVASPGGPFTYVDAGGWPSADIPAILDVVARNLREAGVLDAVIGIPDRIGPLNNLAVPRGALLYLMPPGMDGRQGGSIGERLPNPWLDESLAWLSEDLRYGDTLWARLPPHRVSNQPPRRRGRVRAGPIGAGISRVCGVRSANPQLVRK